MIQEETITVLRAIRKHGPISVRELDAMKVHGARNGCKAAVNTLSNVHRLVDVCGFSGTSQCYVINEEGEKLLRAMDRKAAHVMGEIARPRTSPPAEPYKGERSLHYRPGSQDFLAAPSLHNGELRQRVRPALICPAYCEPVGVGRA